MSTIYDNELENEWLNFMNDEKNIFGDKNNNESNMFDSIHENDEEVPIPTDIYISTKTKISYLNGELDLDTLFWNIPIMNYYVQKEGIIKKQIKFTTTSKEESEKIKQLYDETQCKNMDIMKNAISSTYTVMKHIDGENHSNYKHIVKVNFGMSNKNLTSFRTKEKGVFYNSFTVVIRVYDEVEDEFKEVNIKLFNTGKLQIPGIKEERILLKALKYICKICNSLLSTTIPYNFDTNKIETKLINSNFNCGFYINREALLRIIKHEYGLISMFDSCSYPGIQSKFYYNDNKKTQDGICNCEKQCSKKSNSLNPQKCIEISFMIFRTGSVMIVGKCRNDEMLYEIYEFIKNLLIKHYNTINEGNLDEDYNEKKVVKIKKRRINILTT